MKNFLLSFISLTVFTTAHAQSKFMMVIGGGGEPHKTADGQPRESTIFDGEMRDLGRFTRASGEWKAEVSFNGGHADTELIISEGFGGYSAQTQSFTTAAYNNILTKYEAMLTSGEIKSGDQLLIDINSHGSSSYVGSPDKTHHIATAEGVMKNADTLGSTSVSLDRLQKIIDLASAKGVKLAILDNSCHSGNSLSLANPNTCVITSSGPDHYAYGGSPITFSAKLHQNLAAGKNLEEVFLAARSSMQDLSFPMISTAAGKEVQDRMYSGLTPYLYYFDNRNDKLTPFLNRGASEGGQCHAENQFAGLIREVETLMNASDIESINAATEFKTAVQEYYDYLKDIRAQMSEAGLDNLKERTNFCTEYTVNLGTSKIRTSSGKIVTRNRTKSEKSCVDYTKENLLSLNFDNIISYFQSEAAKPGLTPSERAESEARTNNIIKARAARDQMLAANPKTRSMANFWKSFPDRTTQSYHLGYAVSQAQRKVYNQLYRQSAASSGSNPCRDFVL